MNRKSGFILKLIIITCLLSLSFVNSVLAVEYTYDKNGRLNSATYDNGVTIEYEYDKAGNITSVKTRSGAGDPTTPPTTPTTPATPSKARGHINIDNHAHLTWDAVTVAGSTYIVQRATGESSQEQEYVDISGELQETNYIDTSVTIEQAYSYRVVSLNQEKLRSTPSEAVLIKPLIKVIEETDPAVKYVGNWLSHSLSAHSGGTLVYSSASNASAELEFTGTGIQILASKNTTRGFADVYINGEFVEKVDLYSSKAEYRAVIFEKNFLPQGTHTVKMVWTGEKHPDSRSTHIALDAFQVLESKSTLIEEDNPVIKYEGNWLSHTHASHSGSTLVYSNAKNASAELEFTGTAVQILAYKNSTRGFADVYINGELEQRIDLYSAKSQYKAVVFEKHDLPMGTHTIRFVWTGEKHPDSRSTHIALDGFHVMGPGTSLVEENDPAVVYQGNWIDHDESRHSGGTGKYINAQNAYVEYTFNGTGFQIISWTTTGRGYADVYIDGEWDSRIDMYSPSTMYQAIVYQKIGLSEGNHTVRIVRAGQRNPASTSNTITIDAFRIVH